MEEFPVVEVPVGEYLPDGRFRGREIEFGGMEVGVSDGLWTDTVDPGGVYGFVLRLYECPDGYRVHELVWNLVPGRSAVASLYPSPAGLDHDEESYEEEEAKEQWGQYFPEYFGSR